MHAEMVNDDSDLPDSVSGLTAQKITRIVLARVAGGKSVGYREKELDEQGQMLI